MNDVHLSRRSRSATSAGVKLDRQQIVNAALALADDAGLDALNMRALAGRMGVQASALYWHIDGKDQLLAMMAGEFYRRAFSAAPQDGDWRAWLRAFGHGFRKELLAHPYSARLCAAARPVEANVTDAADRTAAPLVALGLTKEMALACQASVLSLTLGWVLYEQSDTMHDHLAEMVGFDRSYAFGLDALVAGFPTPK